MTRAKHTIIKIVRMALEFEDFEPILIEEECEDAFEM